MTTASRPPRHYGVLIVGCGLAGLSPALRLPESVSVRVVAKGPPERSNTWHAQGGISAVIDTHDSMEAHIEDTMRSGAGLCRREVVEAVVRAGPEEIAWLQSMHVDFTTAKNESGRNALHLAREGGHSHRRIVHNKDQTGRKVQTSLLDAAQARDNITIDHTCTVVDLYVDKKTGVCGGAYILNDTGRVEPCPARVTVLATGGAGKVYLYTSNPDSASGDGIAMGWRAGCRVANLEFMQFHPTCLFAPGEKTLLLSETLRGEGAQLLLPNGTRFMDRYDPHGDLAARDVLARAMDTEMKRLGVPHLYLDVSYKPAAFIKKHFPTLYRRCLDYGYDMAKDRLPVVPAAHYTCGGVSTDLYGRTNVKRLLAIGETACTGLHGANRMASNSLLECLAYASFAAKAINLLLLDEPDAPNIPDWDTSQVTQPNEEIIILQAWHEIRRLMWNYVGIARSRERLMRAQERITLIRREIDEHYRRFKISADFIELRNLATVSGLIVRSALLRRESRGLHYLVDVPHPQTEYEGRDTVLQRRTSQDRRHGTRESARPAT